MIRQWGGKNTCLVSQLSVLYNEKCPQWFLWIILSDEDSFSGEECSCWIYWSTIIQCLQHHRWNSILSFISVAAIISEIDISNLGKENKNYHLHTARRKWEYAFVVFFLFCLFCFCCPVKVIVMRKTISRLQPIQISPSPLSLSLKV